MMLGLAFEGGAARGAFQMGAVKALLESGYEFGGITGTSIGALNAAIVAQGDFEAGYELWRSLNIPMLFNVEDDTVQKLLSGQLDKDVVLHLFEHVKTLIGRRGIDTSRMRRVIESVIDEEKLRLSPVDFGLVTVSLSDIKPVELFKEEIPQGKMIDYLMASASFPGFEPKTIDGKTFIDGGVYDNLPVNLLASRGYREIIAVRTYAAGFTQKAKYKDLKVTNIAPSEDLGPLFNFDPEPIGKNMRMGYYDAMRMIRGLEGKRYYIDRQKAAPGFSCFAGLPDEAISRLAEILGTHGSGKRLLFERIIPRLASMLGLKKDASYDAVFLGLLETLAEPAGLDRYEIYSLQDFAQRLSKKSAMAPQPAKSILQAVGAPDRPAQLRETARIVLDGFIGL